MTLDQFYKLFAQVIESKEYNFRMLDNNNEIRFYDSHEFCYCPITLVAKHILQVNYNTYGAIVVGGFLGLSHIDTINIIEASDNGLSEIRTKLLEIINGN